MEPIAVIMIACFAVALAITFIVYGAWERKYIKTHFTTEKSAYVARKHILNDDEKRKKKEYFIEADVEGRHRDTYVVPKDIFDQIQEGKTYQMTFVYDKVTGVKS